MTRDELILDAAERLFSQRSYDSVGVDAIGEEAGVTGSAIYRHFGSKDEILAALIDRATDELLVRTSGRLEDPDEELARLVREHVDFAVQHRRLAGIAQREQRSLSTERKRALQRRQRPYLERWLDAIDARYPGLAPDEAMAAVRAVHALVTSEAARPSGVREPPQRRELLERMAMGALAALGELGEVGAQPERQKPTSSAANAADASNIG